MKRKLKEETTAVNVGLDLAGLIPGIGEFADAANALIYASRGDYLMAALSLISTIPAIGDVVGKGGKLSLWAQKTFPKASVQVAKYAPDVINTIKALKAAIIANKPLISKIFQGIQSESKTNQVASKLAPHLPRVWEALDVFTRTQEQMAQQQENINSSVYSMLFEDEDIADVAEKAAKEKDKNEKLNLLKKYHRMRSDGFPEPTHVGEPGDTTSGDALLSKFFEAQNKKSWIKQSAYRTGGGIHSDKRDKRNKNRSEKNKKEIEKQLKQESHIIDGGIDKREGEHLAKKIHLNPKREKFGLKDFFSGANHEIEHSKTVKNSPTTIAKIAVDHLEEDPNYYEKLEKIEK
jgi:hypothetical protein